MWTIAKTTYKRTYHGEFCSFAHLFCLLMYSVVFLVPLFLSNYQKSTEFI